MRARRSPAGSRQWLRWCWWARMGKPGPRCRLWRVAWNRICRPEWSPRRIRQVVMGPCSLTPNPLLQDSPFLSSVRLHLLPFAIQFGLASADSLPVLIRHPVGNARLIVRGATQRSRRSGGSHKFVRAATTDATDLTPAIAADRVRQLRTEPALGVRAPKSCVPSARWHRCHPAPAGSDAAIARARLRARRRSRISVSGRSGGQP
jgi:hypothetical protein